MKLAIKFGKKIIIIMRHMLCKKLKIIQFLWYHYHRKNKRMKTKNIHVQNKGKLRKQSKKQKQQRDFKSTRIKVSKTAMTSNFCGCQEYFKPNIIL